MRLASSVGDERRPSRPTATRLPPISATIEPKVRPIAKASASVSVSADDAAYVVFAQ